MRVLSCQTWLACILCIVEKCAEPGSAAYPAKKFRSNPTVFVCILALKKQLVARTAAYFCERHVALALNAKQINWDIL